MLCLHHLAQCEIFTFSFHCVQFLFVSYTRRKRSQPIWVWGQRWQFCSCIIALWGKWVRKAQTVNRFHILHAVISTLSRSAVGLINPQVASLSGSKSSDPLNKKTEGKGAFDILAFQNTHYPIIYDVSTYPNLYLPSHSVNSSIFQSRCCLLQGGEKKNLVCGMSFFFITSHLSYSFDSLWIIQAKRCCSEALSGVICCVDYSWGWISRNYTLACTALLCWAHTEMAD